MSRRLSLAAALAVTAFACRHTERVGNPGTPSTDEEPRAPRVTKIPPREGRPEVAVSPQELMRPGSAKKIQKGLQDEGYLREVTGSLDRETSVALRRFQHDQGLAETGAPDRETLRRLGVDPQEVYSTGSGESAGK